MEVEVIDALDFVFLAGAALAFAGFFVDSTVDTTGLKKRARCERWPPLLGHHSACVGCGGAGAFPRVFGVEEEASFGG